MHKQAVPTCRASNSNIQAHFSAMSIGISQDPLLQARSLVGVVTITYLLSTPEIMCGSSFKSNTQRKLKLIGSRGWKWTLEMLFSPQQLRFTTWKRVHRGNPYKSKAQCLPNCCSHRMWWFLAGFLKTGNIKLAQSNGNPLSANHVYQAHSSTPMSEHGNEITASKSREHTHVVAKMWLARKLHDN